MERRLYFVIGDVVANASVGALCGLAAAALVTESWNVVVAMAVGMFAGMVLAVLAAFALFVWWVGAMEVFVPTMLTGTLAGMLVGMASSMSPLDPSSGAGYGAIVGLASLAAVYAANAAVSGKVTEWTP